MKAEYTHRYLLLLLFVTPHNQLMRVLDILMVALAVAVHEVCSSSRSSSR